MQASLWRPSKVSPGDARAAGAPRVGLRLPRLDKSPLLRFERADSLSPILLGGPHFRTAQPGDNPLCSFAEIFKRLQAGQLRDRVSEVRLLIEAHMRSDFRHQRSHFERWLCQTKFREPFYRHRNPLAVEGLAELTQPALEVVSPCRESLRICVFDEKTELAQAIARPEAS